MKYYLYILRSIKDGNCYIGITADIKRRLACHNSGKVRSTRSRKPFNIIYTELHNSIAEARIREKYLKSYSGAKEKRNIIGGNLNIGE